MAWRIVKQPNEKYARFSDVVDDFTHANMTRNGAIEICCEYMSRRLAIDKVDRGYSADYFNNEIETIKIVHGEKLATKRKKELSAVDT